MTDQPSATPDFEAPDTDPDDYLHTFAPVPGRSRRDGWTPERQRDFIARLRKTGTVSVAAASVGMTHQSAYRLRNRPGAAEFATAWDRALAEARSNAVAFDRSIDGYWSPRFYRGQFVGTMHRYDTRMMIAALRASHARAPMKGEE